MRCRSDVGRIRINHHARDRQNGHQQSRTTRWTALLQGSNARTAESLLGSACPLMARYQTVFNVTNSRFFGSSSSCCGMLNGPIDNAITSPLTGSDYSSVYCCDSCSSYIANAVFFNNNLGVSQAMYANSPVSLSWQNITLRQNQFGLSGGLKIIGNADAHLSHITIEGMPRDGRAFDARQITT